MPNRSDPNFAYAHLNCRIMPVLRGERFETPLEQALNENGLGEVGGGGTMQLKSGEIEFCGIDVDLFDLERGGRFVCEFLAGRGAPKGSRLEYELEGRRIALPFGVKEGLAIYLNGTELPDEVYANSDSNELIDSINQHLASHGDILGHWQGPTETALYLYGNSADEMRRLIATVLADDPLCQRARIERIA